MSVVPTNTEVSEELDDNQSFVTEALPGNVFKKYPLYQIEHPMVRMDYQTDF
jgi:hypothetical protein